MTYKIKHIALGATLILLGGCSTVKTVGKVASFPVKAAYKTGELTGKGVVGTGKGVIGTGKIAGKGVYHTGKGAYKTGRAVYNVAKVPVQITNAALDTSVKVLTVTTQVVDLGGKVVAVSRTMNRAEVDGYIQSAKGAANVLGILVDVAQRF